MAKVTHYKVWIHIEGLDKDGDTVKGDDYFEPHEVACVRREKSAEAIRERLLNYASDNHLHLE